MLPRFYPIVPDAAWVERLAKLGVKLVQLRMKNIQRDQIAPAIDRALQSCQKYDCQLVVNDYWREAIDCKATYVHLGQEDVQYADIQAIRRHGIKIGISTHSHDELDIALSHAPDYVALGPIYETTLKVMKWQPQGLSRLREWKQLTNRPLVAIGGITLERAPAVYDAGADSIAIVTDVVFNPDPEARTHQWLQLSEAG